MNCLPAKTVSWARISCYEDNAAAAAASTAAAAAAAAAAADDDDDGYGDEILTCCIQTL